MPIVSGFSRLHGRRPLSLSLWFSFSVTLTLISSSVFCDLAPVLLPCRQVTAVSFLTRPGLAHFTCVPLSSDDSHRLSCHELDRSASYSISVGLWSRGFLPGKSQVLRLPFCLCLLDGVVPWSSGSSLLP